MKSSQESTVIFSNKIEIKPLSVNEAWQGRRFKTEKYKNYEKLLLFSLPPSKTNWDKIPIDLTLSIGFSNVASDIDNAVKPFIDVLQKRYKFNDKYIFRLIVEKEMVTKGKEFIKFTIKKFSKDWLF